MSKKAFLKKWLKICGPIIGAPIIFSPIIAVANLAPSKSVPAIETTSVDARSTTAIPDNTLNLADVTTGIAIIKNTFDTVIPQEFLQTTSIDDLKTFIEPYFYIVKQDPFTGEYQSVVPSEPPVYEMSKPTFDNKAGTVSFNCTFATAYEAGKPVTNKVFPIVMDGFKKVLGPTSPKPNPDFPFSEVEKQTIISKPEILQKTIVIDNLPPNAKDSVKIVPIDDTLTNRGSFQVEVTVSQYYDDDQVLVDDENSYIVTFNGLMNTPNTVVNQKTDANYNLYPWQVKKDELLQYVDFTDLPSDATITVNFDPTTGCNNKLGEVSFELDISHYYDNGVLVGTPPAGSKATLPASPLNIKLTGFKKALGTSTIKALPGVTNFKPSIIDASNIANYFDVTTFPPDVTFSGGNFDANDLTGTLTITNLEASCGYADDANLTLVKPFAVPEFTINGLLKQEPTKITVVDNDLTTNKVLATSITAPEILNKYVVIENLPPWAIVTVESISANNLDGSLDFKLRFSDMYDDKGVLIKDHLSDVLHCQGFEVVTESSISQKPDLDLTDVYASSLNSTNISNYIDFNSFPSNTYFYQYKFENVNNTTGTVTFKVTADYWYDDKGNPQPAADSDINQKEFSVNLSGFAIQEPTTIVKNPAIDNSNTLASSITTTAQIESLFTIENQSKDPDFPTRLMATNFKSNNITGELKFTLTINNYYDENGIFNKEDDSNYEPLIKEYTFDNYKTVNQSIVTQKAQPKKLLPTDFQDPTIAPQIVDYIDTSTFPEGTTFKYDVVNPINKTGTFELIVTASQWYDKTGQLITTPNRFNVKIVGCKQQQPTKIIQTPGLNLTGIIASDVDTIDELKNYITFLYPYGPNPEPITDWSATNFHYKNSAGKLTVDIRLNQYYDSNGNPVKPGSDSYQPMLETIEISGFKTTSASALVQKPNPTTGSILPTTVKSNGTWQEYVDFSSFPAGYSIVSVNLFPVDKEGTLRVSASVKGFYNEAGDIDNNQQIFTVELNGFKTQTEVTTVAANPNTDNTVSTSAAIDLIKNNPDEFFNKYVIIGGLVPGTTKKILSPFADNAKGILTVSISLDKYYDANGNLVTAAENKGMGLLVTISIPGFKSNQKTTFSQNPAFANTDITASDFCDEFNALTPDEQATKFKEIVKIDSPVEDATYFSFNLNPINVDGQVLFNYVASKVYNSNGDIVTNQQCDITINNFKKESPSTLNELKGIDKDFPATDLTINEDNFWNFFDNTNFPEGIKPMNVSCVYYNNKGQIDVTAEMPSYFDINGNLVNTPKYFSASLTGFVNVLSPSKLIKKPGVVSELFKLTPNAVNNNNTSQSSKDAIFSELVDTSSFPQTNTILGTTGATFSVLYIIPDNLKGEITFIVSVDEYYGGKNNNLIATPSQQQVTITGFKQITPSTITVKNRDIIPSQLKYSDLVWNNFIGTPPSPDDVIFRDVDDENGTVTVVVQNCSFYDAAGEERNNQPFQVKLNLAIPAPPTNTALILGLSLGIGIPVLLGIGLYAWRRYYKKTHEV